MPMDSGGGSRDRYGGQMEGIDTHTHPWASKHPPIRRHLRVLARLGETSALFGKARNMRRLAVVHTPYRSISTPPSDTFPLQQDSV